MPEKETEKCPETATFKPEMLIGSGETDALGSRRLARTRIERDSKCLDQKKLTFSQGLVSSN